MFGELRMVPSHPAPVDCSGLELQPLRPIRGLASAVRRQVSPAKKLVFTISYEWGCEYLIYSLSNSISNSTSIVYL